MMTYSRAMTLLLSAILFTSAGVHAFAQDTSKAKSGEETRLAVLGSLKADCSVNPAPTVKVLQAAAHGTVRIAKARLKTQRFPKCAKVEVPVQVISYRSNPGFKGQDDAVVEISFKPGEASSRTFSIIVE